MRYLAPSRWGPQFAHYSWGWNAAHQDTGMEVPRRMARALIKVGNRAYERLNRWAPGMWHPWKKRTHKTRKAKKYPGAGGYKSTKYGHRYVYVKK